jgi:hypothetical protein
MIHNLILGASIIFPIACGVMGFLVTTSLDFSNVGGASGRGF